LCKNLARGQASGSRQGDHNPFGYDVPLVDDIGHPSKTDPPFTAFPRLREIASGWKEHPALAMTLCIMGDCFPCGDDVTYWDDETSLKGTGTMCGQYLGWGQETLAQQQAGRPPGSPLQERSPQKNLSTKWGLLLSNTYPFSIKPTAFLILVYNATSLVRFDKTRGGGDAA
jgi:hypothetical protein